MPIESFVTTASHFPVSHLIEPFFLMTRTKFASVCFVAARNLMRQEDLDHADAEPPPGRGRSQSTTTCESSYVLDSTSPVLVCTTKYCSSTTPYYKVLLQYYSVLKSTTPVLQSAIPVLSVLHSTTPVLVCTTKYYFSTSLYYKVLLQYYKVPLQYYKVLLHGLVCTTKYYPSTSLYYKVLLHYYCVLQGTIPVLLCTTKYYSTTTLYYKVLLQYYSVLQSTIDTYDLTKGLVHPAGKKSSNYYSFARSTRTILRNGCSVNNKMAILLQFRAIDIHDLTKGFIGHRQDRNFITVSRDRPWLIKEAETTCKMHFPAHPFRQDKAGSAASAGAAQVYSLKHQLGTIVMVFIDSAMLKKNSAAEWRSGQLVGLANQRPLDRNEAPLCQIQINERVQCVQATRPIPFDGKKDAKKDEATDIGTKRWKGSWKRHGARRLDCMGAEPKPP